MEKPTINDTFQKKGRELSSVYFEVHWGTGGIVVDLLDRSPRASLLSTIVG